MICRMKPDPRPRPDELPGSLPTDVLLARSATTVVVLGAIRVYSTGLSAHLSLNFRDEGPDDALHSLLGRRMDRPGDEIAMDDVLVLGVEYSDGRTGHSNDQSGEVLVGFGGGHGGPGFFDATVWISPLPPEGPTVISCSWPARAVDGRMSIDGAAVLHAARSTTALWPD